MTSTLSPNQVNRVLQLPRTTQTVARIEYDASLDDTISGMFGRRHDEMETFPPTASRAYHALVYGAILGGGPHLFEDVPWLMSIAARTNNLKLRSYACSALRSYLRDCSGTDASLKPVVRQILESLGESL